MAESLENLSENLRNKCDTEEKLRAAFPITSKEFSDYEQLKFITQKNVYPYEFIDSFEKLNVTELPPKESFYSKLTDSHISDDDYNMAKEAWKIFNCKSLLDYHNKYLTSDVLLLADIWQAFRNVCFDTYKLDANYYYTAPGLSWDAWLKYSKVELELLTDIDMVLMFERGIRGGISQIYHRYSKANNHYMKEYNENEEETYIVYWDANNLYGGAMREKLPYKNFKWNTDTWTADDILRLDDQGEKGFLFMVDLEYSKELHKSHNQFAFCPENIAIKKSDLNEWQQEGYAETKIKKLCTTLEDKKDYVVNYRYLKLALKHGLKLTKISKCIEYDQDYIMKSYIDLNTNKRKQAKNDFEKDFYKLMNNSVFGKTMENVRNRENFNLINTKDELLRLTFKPTYAGEKIFRDDLVGVQMKKTTVTLNKPIYIGQNILDQSKVTMYSYHYDFMIPKFGIDNINLLFGDTDSLAYEIRKIDPYVMMNENRDYFDLSEYPNDHFCYDKTNGKIPLKMKDETKSVAITEFCGLRAKCYAFTKDIDEKKTKIVCKGIKKGVAKKFKLEQYKAALFDDEKLYSVQNTFRTDKHTIYTIEQNKLALSRNDDKRFVSNNFINTYSFGFVGERI